MSSLKKPLNVGAGRHIWGCVLRTHPHICRPESSTRSFCSGLMNKAQIREILGDLKAAVRLGQSEAIEMALDGLRALPIVEANDRFEAGFLSQLIRPAGEILSRLSAARLLPLLDDRPAALRAVGAAALAQRFLIGEDVNPEMIIRPARDARPEVRAALGETLREAGEAHPERLLHLVETWLRDPSPKVRTAALTALPALSPSYGEDILALIAPLKDDEDPGVCAAIVEAMQTIAQSGSAESVLRQVSAWGAEPRPNVWVISRTLSGSWAASHPREVKSILRDLYAKVGKTKEIAHALRALERHGVKIEIE